jgi:MATE family multidrug resistance protein
LALGLACAAVALTLAFEWKMKRMIRREPVPGHFDAIQAE